MEEQNKNIPDQKSEIEKTEEIKKEIPKKAIIIGAIIAVVAIIAIICIILLGGKNSPSGNTPSGDNPSTENHTSYDAFTFYPQDDGTYLVGIGNGKYLSEIVIPSTYNGGKVVGIADDGFAECKNLTKITLPDSITSIGEYAFSYCESLSNIVLGNGVENIENYAFSSCISLTSIVIPSSVKNIDSGAFDHCNKLVEVINHSSLPISSGDSSFGKVGYYAKEVHTGESKIVNKNDYLFLTYNGINYLLGYIGKDTDLLLPDNYNNETYEIYDYAFYHNYNITNVKFSNYITNIGCDAFEKCTSLTSVILGNRVTNIASEAFRKCSSLKTIVIPNSVTKISGYAFEYTSVKDIYYTGTEIEWSNISKESNYELNSATIHYNYIPEE